MKKTKTKICRNLKQKKAKMAFKARKIRKNSKQNIQNKKISTITKAKKISRQKSFTHIIIKKNLLPAAILIAGCFLFFFGEDVNYIKLQTESKKYIRTGVSTLNKAIAKIINIHEININNSKIKNQVTNLDKPNKSAENIVEKKENVKPSIEKTKIKSEQEVRQHVITLNKNDDFHNLDNMPNAEEIRDQIGKIIKNTPMEAMLNDIVSRKRAVAAFLLGIGMKESKYGIYSPKKDGAECFNYWGYRGKENTTKSGYSCFDSPEHAVKIVGDRIEDLIKLGRNTPTEMVVWKCGYSCAGHTQESVDKWIADVSINYYRLNPDHPLAKK